MVQPLSVWLSRNKGYLRQVLVCCAVSILAFLFGMIQTWSSLAIQKLLDGVPGFTATRNDISIIVTMITLGMFLMPILFGFLMVKMGRKKNLVLSSIFYITAWVLIIFAESPIWLMVANLSGGLGCGIVLIIGPIYIAEIADKRIRGALISFYVTVFAVGEVFLTTVGIFISYFTLNFLALMVAFVAFFCVVALATESPHWHMMSNKNEKAEKSFKYYWNANSDTEDGQTSTAASLAELKETVDAEMRSNSSYLELFRTPSNMRASIIVIVLSFLQAGSGILAILSYGSTTLPKYDGFWEPNPTMALVNTLDMVFNIIGMVLIDRWGRKPLSIISNAGDALGTGIMAIYFFINEYTSYDTTNIKWVPYVGIIIYICFYGVAMAAMPHILVGELFPANVRYHASVMSVCCISAGLAFLNFIYLHVSDFVGVSVMYMLFTVCSIAATIFSCFYVFETKNLSLAEIQLKAVGRNQNHQTRL